MGAMSDLHALATQVSETDATLDAVAAGSSYPRWEIAWAVRQLRQP